jgi:hypothetical protein
MNFSHPLVRRLIISGIIGIVLSIAISEGAYQALRDDTDRDPQTVELVIPDGTADQVEAGNTVESIPEKMVFVEGDVLLVKNEDTTNHQLGPVWVPPGATGRLVMENANNYSYGCSFQPSRYLGLDVRPRGASLTSRILALLFVAPPTIGLIAVYSTLVIPLRPKKPAPATTPAQKHSSRKVGRTPVTDTSRPIMGEEHTVTPLKNNKKTNGRDTQ